MESVTDRITRYLLSRMRRHAVLDLYESAACAGLLETQFIDHDEDHGTVWSVPQETLRQLSAHPAGVHKKIGRRLRKPVLSNPGSTLKVFDMETNSDAVLEVSDPGLKANVREALASNPRETREQAAGPAISASEGMLTQKHQDILALLRQHLAAPDVASVAVALLVARAVGSSLPCMSAVRAVLHRPGPFVLIKAPVPRFERRFAQMLEEGMILPYRVRIEDVYYNASLREDHRPGRKTVVRRPMKLLSVKGARSVKNTTLSRHLSDALNDRSAPVIVVDETPLPPPASLSMTADVMFECAGLDHTLLAELLHITLGIAPKQSLTQMEALALDLEGLSIDDLTLAIRPTRDLEAILAILSTLGEQARAADEDEDGKDSKRRTNDRNERNAKSKTGAKASGSAIEGVDIIQPVNPPVGTTVEKPGGQAAEAASMDTNPLRHLRVETLSGYGEARQWALDLKEDLQLWSEGGLAWSEISTKLLLSGPPGTGKTTFARALCNSLQVPLLATSVAAWLEPGYLGDVLKRMSLAFETARNHAPAILFIDEIDNIGSRGGGRRDYDDYWRSLVNRMLELLDGASKTNGVIVVAATNLPQTIDPALLRSGRLEKHVAIPMPDVEALSDILAHHLAADLPTVLSSAPAPSAVRRLRPPKAKDHDPQQPRKTSERRMAQAKGVSQ